MNLEKEGWLKKNGEKRYVSLSDGELRWSTEPFGKVKNFLTLQRFSLGRVGGDSFAMLPGAGCTSQKVYEFVAETAGEAQAWAQAIKSWELGAIFPAGSQRNRAQPGDEQLAAGSSRSPVKSGDLQSSAAGSAAGARASARRMTEPVRREASSEHLVLGLSQGNQKSLARHAGWLLKKGKKRFFLIHRRVLYWAETALKAPASGADLASDTSEEGRAFLKHCKGSLGLSNLSVEPVGDKMLELIMSSSGTKYLLTAALNQERDVWLDAIRYALASQGQLLDVAAGPESERRGHLTVKGAGGKQFVVLRRGLLLWYSHEDDSQPKGVVRVERCSMERAPDDRGFSVIRDDGRVHRFQGKDPVDVARWIDAIQTAMKREAQREAAAVASASSRENSADFSAGTAANNAGGNQPSPLIMARRATTASTVPRASEGGFGLSVGSAMPSAASSRDHRRSFYQHAHRSSWVDFKGKRKFLVLKNNTLLLFDKEAGSEVVAHAKQSFSLHRARVTRDTQSSAQARTIVVHVRSGGGAGTDAGGGGTTGELSSLAGVGAAAASAAAAAAAASAASDLDSGEEHAVKFTFLDLSVANEWEMSLKLAVERCMVHSAEADPEHGAQTVCKGMLQKKGKERWFELTSGGRLAWFQHEGDAAPRNHLMLQDASVSQMGASSLLSIQLPTGKRYELLCPTPVEARRWLGQLKEVAKSMNAVLHPYRTFGESLESDGDGNEGELPAVVADTLACLRAGALQVPGLFRESGDASDINLLRESYDSGLRPTLPINCPHEVAGLLKLWLRSLPHGLVPPDQARQWLDADAGDSPAQMIGLLDLLPPVHRRVFVALLEFFAEFTEFSELTKMTPRNLALSFGTSLLRPPGNELDVLTDTPAAIQTVEELIVAWKRSHPARGDAAPRSAPRSSIPPGVTTNLLLLAQVNDTRELGEPLLSALKRAIENAKQAQDSARLADLNILLKIEQEQ